jgi:Domain of unknown function (DUF4338)
VIRYCGRNFSPDEIRRISCLVEEDSSRMRAELSRLACELLDWRKPNGGLKDMSCRVAMIRMNRDGLIPLPPPTRQKPVCKIIPGPRTDPQPFITAPVHELSSARLQRVLTPEESSLWNEYVQRYHYLGHTLVPGAQLRYFALSEAKHVAMLSFSASAWQVAPRDCFIGWSHEQRKKNLHLIINNSRFLILPWVRSKGLASKILAMAARQALSDWDISFGYRPVLMETFVEKKRFKGTCYKAANWVRVGQTKGRGKLGPSGKMSVPIKDIWLYPLTRKFRAFLTL